jgi:hypothetical protein
MMATGGAIRKMAQDLQKKGNNGDTILAHINPEEAKMLKAAGGSGTVNPKTGLLQFEDDSSAGDWAGSAGADGEGGGGASMGGGDDTVWAVMLAVLVLTLALMVALLKIRHPRGVTQTLQNQVLKPCRNLEGRLVQGALQQVQQVVGGISAVVKTALEHRTLRA